MLLTPLKFDDLEDYTRDWFERKRCQICPSCGGDGTDPGEATGLCETCLGHGFIGQPLKEGCSHAYTVRESACFLGCEKCQGHLDMRKPAEPGKRGLFKVLKNKT